MSSVVNKAKAKATGLKTKTSYHKEKANAPSHKADDWNIEWTTHRFNNCVLISQIRQVGYQSSEHGVV